MENRALWDTVGECLTPILSTVKDDLIDTVSRSISAYLNPPKSTNDDKEIFTIDEENIYCQGVSFWDWMWSKGDRETPALAEPRLTSIVFDFVEFEGKDLNPMQILLIESKIETNGKHS